MATIRSYTSLEQSKKLSKILPPESADMHWIVLDGAISSATAYNHFDLQEFNRDKNTFREYIPCFSLSSLLSVLNFPSLTQEKENEWEVCVFDHDNDNYIEVTASNPVDACYEMILRLDELKML